MHEYFDKLGQLLAANIPFVAVTIVDTIGSVPQNAGSKMLVTVDGLFYGTVGGGKIERRAISEALEILAASCKSPGCRSRDADQGPPDAKQPASGRSRFVAWSLSKDIGMTCGGSVKLYFECFNTGSWNIAVFGAGHCSNALINLLCKLDCRIVCFDPRQMWLDALPDSPKLKKILSPDMPSCVKDIPDNAFVVLMTMGHTTDKPILLSILETWSQRSFPYLGVIGSRAKRAQLLKDIAQAGLPEKCKDLFYCPMGLPLGNNHPQEIALSIVCQLIQIRDADTGRG
ncbi:MAG: XdhC family protein [Candidatus Obscuribacterales bacterium]|nr:XdhC family protein [Candidatus Obscuribacterales bacterium]